MFRSDHCNIKLAYKLKDQHQESFSFVKGIITAVQLKLIYFWFFGFIPIFVALLFILLLHLSYLPLPIWCFPHTPPVVDLILYVCMCLCAQFYVELSEYTRRNQKHCWLFANTNNNNENQEHTRTCGIVKWHGLAPWILTVINSLTFRPPHLYAQTHRETCLHKYM